MYMGRYRSGGGGGGVKRSVKDRLGVGSSWSPFDQHQKVVKRQRQDHEKRNTVVSDRKVEEKTLGLTAATVQKDLPGSSKNATRGSVREMPKKVLNANAGSIKVSDMKAMLRRRQTDAGLTGPSDVEAISIAGPKEGDSPAMSVMLVKSGIGLVSATKLGLVTAKKPTNQSRSALNTQQKQLNLAEELDVTSFLQSLGLSKYAITFKAEEVDMFAPRHMKDCDLKEIGLPMGPRKKILVGLASTRIKK